MKYIKKSVINGTVTAPASKSMMQRAIAACFLSAGEAVITNTSYCNDTLSAISVIENLGATVLKNKKELLIYPASKINNNILNCGESGLGFRMFSPISALYDKELILTGEGSLLKRPVDMVEKALLSLGVICNSNDGFLPLTIKGPLKAQTIEIDAAITSQLLTGLLMALPLCEQNSCIKVCNLKSKPYIDMTLELLNNFGILVENNDYKEFIIEGNQKYKAIKYNVEGDWSGAAFLMVAAAITGKVTINNLSYNSSKQADKIIIDVLKSAGARVEINKDFVVVEKNKLHAFNFDATDCPDLFPPLVALAINCNGSSTITGVERLVHKESNRAKTLCEEFEKIDADIKIEKNSMLINSSTDKLIKGGKTFSNNDHRIAMACAVAGLNSDDGVFVQNWEAVSKSYPDFFEDIKKLGAGVE